MNIRALSYLIGFAVALSSITTTINAASLPTADQKIEQAIENAKTAANAAFSKRYELENAVFNYNKLPQGLYRQHAMHRARLRNLTLFAIEMHARTIRAADEADKAAEVAEDVDSWHAATTAAERALKAAKAIEVVLWSPICW